MRGKGTNPEKIGNITLSGILRYRDCYASLSFDWGILRSGFLHSGLLRSGFLRSAVLTAEVTSSMKQSTSELSCPFDSKGATVY
jgi:hypothetical protein